jgi:hypothetical protein
VSNGLFIRQSANLPTECARCGAADFSVVVEIAYGIRSRTVMHWICPPSGWFLLREARPRKDTALIHARCPTCMQQVSRAGV